MKHTAIEPRIYVASLSDYNTGRLHGRWIDLEGKSEEDVWDEINTMLADSKNPNVTRYKCKTCGHIEMTQEECDKCRGSEIDLTPIPSADEWAIHDYELGGIKISENESIEKIVEIVELLSEHGEAFADYVEYVGLDNATSEEFQDAYRGQYDSEEAFAEELLDETGELDAIPENLRYYFDYEKYARDLFIDNFWMSNNGHVFWRH